MARLPAKSNSRPKFSADDRRKLEALRQYVTKLRELAASDALAPTAKGKIDLEIEMATDMIVVLEIQKIKSEIDRDLGDLL